MIKALVAEDEFPLLRGICRMIEKLDSDFHVVKTATSGKEVLEYLEKNSVDVVFTDINMPIVDGLEVLNYLKKNMPQTISIIISGYQDFSYAQQAIQYGAKRYLLKPIDKEELFILLQEVKQDLMCERKNEKDIILKEALSGKKTFENKKKLNFERLYPIYVIAKAYCRSSSADEIFDSDFWDEVRLKKNVEEWVQGLGGLYLYPGKYSNEMIIILESEEDINIEDVAEHFIHGKWTQIPLAVSCGGACDNLSDLNSVIPKIRNQLCMKWIYGKQEMIDQNREVCHFNMTKSAEDTLQFLIRQGKMREFQKVLKDLQKQMEKEEITQYDLELVLNKIVFFFQTFRNESFHEETVNPDGVMNEIIMRASSLEEVFDEFWVWCQESLSFEKGEETEELVKRLDLYILEHYKESITTIMLAQQFGLVPSYLSRLFREYKGVTPNRYIQDIRIEKSKELLINYPSMMTKDVAQMVGYVDSSYFSKVFKKSTNMYPSEYRMSKLT